MDVKYTILVIFGLVARFYCDIGDNGTTGTDNNNSTVVEPPQNSTEVEDATNSTEVEATTNSTEVEETVECFTRGLYGGTYYNSNATNPLNIHYIHGTYQPPTKNYYKSQEYFRDEGTDSTFDYYLGFGISKMTNEDFHYEDFQYYCHDINRTMSDQETIPSDFIIACHPNSTFLCPENTENVCLMNGTIFCMSWVDVVVPCPQNESLDCVDVVVPCVNGCIEVADNFEKISLPCLGTLVVVDVYEHKGKSLSKVGGTFVIVDAIEEKKRTFCVTVIVDPKKDGD